MIEKFESLKSPVPHGVELPEIIIDQKYYEELGLGSKPSNYEFLRHLCLKGVKEKGIDELDNKQEYFDRVKMELDTLKDLEFVDYILLNWDVLNFCHEEDIPVGRGRGSAAGSLVLFLIGVTDIDPMRYSLFFERFISRSRAKKIEVEGQTYLEGGLLPDIDNDIDFVNRSRVIEYIESKYPNKTSKILTLNTLSSKICIKEAAKIVEEYSEEVANEISKLIPELFNKPLSLAESVDKSEGFKKWAERHPAAFAIARKIEKLIKNTGVHPSGIAISKRPLIELCPLQYTKDNELVSGYDMKHVSEYAVKFDILGLRTLSVVDMTKKLTGIDPSEVDLEDSSIYEPTQDLRVSKGLFQIGEKTNLRVCKDVAPSTIDEVSDVVALARPGALQFLGQYVKVKSGEEGVEERHPILDKIILKSNGCLLFQEQLMQIANQVFELSLEDAESIRRACGKKIKKDMEIWKPRIYEQAEKLGLGTDLADFYWGVCLASADYSFNLSHSVSYASLAAITLFYKFKHPVEFHTSLLNMTVHEQKTHKEIREIANELPFFGIKLLPPDINKSDIDFKVEDGNIRYGFKAIKNISDKTFSAMMKIKGSHFKNKFEMFAALKQSGLNITATSNLIRAGILGVEGSRSRLVLEAQVYNILSDREKREFPLLGDKYDFDILNLIADLSKKESRGSDGRLHLSERRFGTIKKKTEPYKNIFLQNRKYDSLANWFFESNILGYSYSEKLKGVFEEQDAQTFVDLNLFEDLPDKSQIKCVGQVREVNINISRTGNKYMRLEACDDFGVRTFLFGNSARDAKLDAFLENHGEVKEGDILILTGSKNQDIVYCDEIRRMKMPVGFKLKTNE